MHADVDRQYSKVVTQLLGEDVKFHIFTSVSVLLYDSSYFMTFLKISKQVTHRKKHVLLVLVYSTRIRHRVSVLNNRHRFT